MAIFNNFPYTNFHELNLDWVLSKMKELDVKVDSFPSYIDKYIDGKLTDEALLALIYEAIMNYGMVINVKAPPEGLSPAVGDGATDDTTAIQAAIDYAGEVKGTVFFPSGTYKTVDPLDIPSNVSIIGFSPYNTKIALASDADVCIDVHNNQNIKIEGLTITCNTLGETTDNVCITGSQVQNLEISNCRIGVANDGIVVTIKGDMYIKDVYLYSIGHIGAELNRQTTSAVLTIDGLAAAAFSTSSENVLVTNVNNAVINNICFRTKCSIACEIAGNNCQVTGRINIATTKYLDAGTGNTFVLNDEIKTNAPIEASNVKVTSPVKYETPSAYNSYFKTVKMVDKANNEEYNVLVEGDELADLTSKSFGDINFDNTVFFGDSYTEGYRVTPADVYCHTFASLMNMSTYQVFGYGGCGFAHAHNNMNFLEAWNASNIQNPTGVTAVVVMGGWNDKDQSESNIRSGITALFSQIKQTCPNAEIVFIPSPSFAPIKRAVLQTIIKHTTNAGAIVVNSAWWWQLGDVDYFDDDRVHPNVAGHKNIARALYSTIKGGVYEHHVLYKLDDAQLGSVTSTFNILYDNDMVTFYISGNTSGTTGGNDIATIPNVFFGGNNASRPTQLRFMTPFGSTSSLLEGYGTIELGTDNLTGGQVKIYPSRKIDVELSQNEYATGQFLARYCENAMVVFG